MATVSKIVIKAALDSKGVYKGAQKTRQIVDRLARDVNRVSKSINLTPANKLQNDAGRAAHYAASEMERTFRKRSEGIYGALFNDKISVREMHENISNLTDATKEEFRQARREIGALFGTESGTTGAMARYALSNFERSLLDPDKATQMARSVAASSELARNSLTGLAQDQVNLKEQFARGIIDPQRFSNKMARAAGVANEEIIRGLDALKNENLLTPAARDHMVKQFQKGGITAGEALGQSAVNRANKHFDKLATRAREQFMRTGDNDKYDAAMIQAHAARNQMLMQRMDSMSRRGLMTDGVKKRLVNEMHETGVNAGRAMTQAITKTYTTNMRSFAYAMTSIGRDMTFMISMPMAMIGAAGIKVMHDFEFSMNRVQGYASATNAEMESVVQKARELGATTQFTAAQVGDAMVELSKAGYTVEQGVGSLESVLKLAASGNLDMAKATDITTSIMQSYGLEVGELDEAVQVLVKTFTSAKVELTDLGISFRYVGAIAKSAGMEFTEVNAILATFAKAGLRGSMAGTMLRRTISRLVNPSARASKAMKELKLQVFDDQGKMLAFPLIIKQLEEAGASMKQLYQIFDLRAAPGVQILVDQGWEELIETQKKLADHQQKADEVSRKMMSGMRGAFLELKSVAQEAAIAIGESGVLQAVVMLARALKDLFLWVRNASTGIKHMIAFFMLAVTAAGPLLWIAGSLSRIFFALKVSNIALGTAMATVAPVVVAMAVAFGGLYYWIRKVIAEQYELTKLTMSYSDALRGMTKEGVDFSVRALKDRISALTEEQEHLEDLSKKWHVYRDASGKLRFNNHLANAKRLEEIKTELEMKQQLLEIAERIAKQKEGSSLMAELTEQYDEMLRKFEEWKRGLDDNSLNEMISEAITRLEFYIKMEEDAAKPMSVLLGLQRDLAQEIDDTGGYLETSVKNLTSMLQIKDAILGITRLQLEVQEKYTEQIIAAADAARMLGRDTSLSFDRMVSRIKELERVAMGDVVAEYATGTMDEILGIVSSIDAFGKDLRADLEQALAMGDSSWKGAFQDIEDHIAVLRDLSSSVDTPAVARAIRDQIINLSEFLRGVERDFLDLPSYLSRQDKVNADFLKDTHDAMNGVIDSIYRFEASWGNVDQQTADYWKTMNQLYYEKFIKPLEDIDTPGAARAKLDTGLGKTLGALVYKMLYAPLIEGRKWIESGVMALADAMSSESPIAAIKASISAYIDSIVTAFEDPAEMAKTVVNKAITSIAEVATLTAKAISTSMVLAFHDFADAFSPGNIIDIPMMGAGLINQLISFMAPLAFFGEIISSMANALKPVLEPLEPIFNTLAHIVGERLAPVFEKLEPVLEQFYPIIDGLMQIFAPLLSAMVPLIAAFIPLLEALFPVFKFLGYLVALASEGISYMIGAIVWLTGQMIANMGRLIAWIGQKLGLGGIQDTGKSIRDFGKDILSTAGAFFAAGKGFEDAQRAILDAKLGDSFETLADSANSAAGALINMPEIFDYHLRRRMASMDLGAEDGIEYGGSNSGVSLTVEINNPPSNMDVEAVTEQVTTGIVKVLKSPGHNALKVAVKGVVG